MGLLSHKGKNLQECSATAQLLLSTFFSKAFLYSLLSFYDVIRRSPRKNQIRLWEKKRYTYTNGVLVLRYYKRY